MPTADGAGDKRSSADRSESTRRTMAEVSHQNPYTTETLGKLYRRGPAAEDDGPEKPDDDESTMGDVDHTPRNDDVNHVWTRGVRGMRDGSDGRDEGDGRDGHDGSDGRNEGYGRDGSNGCGDSANEDVTGRVDGNEPKTATKRTKTDVSGVRGDL